MNDRNSTPTVPLRWLADEARRIRINRRWARVEASIAAVCIAVWCVVIIDAVRMVLR